MFTRKQPAFPCNGRELAGLCHRLQSFSPGGSVGHDCSGRASLEASTCLPGFSPSVAPVPEICLNIGRNTAHATGHQADLRYFFPSQDESREERTQTCQTGAACSGQGVNPAIGCVLFGAWVVFKIRTFYKQILLLRENKSCRNISPTLLHITGDEGKG